MWAPCDAFTGIYVGNKHTCELVEWHLHTQLKNYVNIFLNQWFPTFLGLWCPTEENYNLRHPVANPQQFALRFDDSLKMYF